jgi:putative hemolysin
MKKILLLPALLALIIGCSQESTSPDNANLETGPPEIMSLTADKLQILYGGQDPAFITCIAKGGNLKYVWEVDLGDIIPMNADRSKISFNGSACCVGEKTITCTVSNSLGSTSKKIIITILEVINPPEIITVESNKTEINSSTNETAAFVCYAIGGNLNYAWETDCGNMVINETDNSKATMTATTDCVGIRKVTCTVSNEKGIDTKTFQITIGK